MEAFATDVHRVDSIICGKDHTLALLASGKVLGWGGDGSGRVSPDTPDYCSPFKAPTRAVEVNLLQPQFAVTAGYGVSLRITADQQVTVWGASAANIGGTIEAIPLRHRGW